MNEFTDLEHIDLEELSTEVLESFCDRYMLDATRIVNTGIFLPGDMDMCRTAIAIVLGMYLKKLAEENYIKDKVIH